MTAKVLVINSVLFFCPANLTELLTNTLGTRHTHGEGHNTQIEHTLAKERIQVIVKKQGTKVVINFSKKLVLDMRKMKLYNVHYCLNS